MSFIARQRWSGFWQVNQPPGHVSSEFCETLPGFPYMYPNMDGLWWKKTTEMDGSWKPGYYMWMVANPAPPCMVETPLNNGINHVSTGAGFLPSIISPNLPELINKCSFDQECPGNYTGKRTCAMCSYENGDRTPGNRYHIWSAAISPSQMELGFNIAMRSKKMI